MSMTRYTARGGAEVEARIRVLIGEVGEAVTAAVEPRHLRALLLIGGYGRGEGGVEVREGVEHPHNNLDFLLVTRGVRRGALEFAVARSNQCASACPGRSAEYAREMNLDSISAWSRNRRCIMRHVS
jgi:hypothetical protein